jgi:hypothetical protein
MAAPIHFIVRRIDGSAKPAPTKKRRRPIRPHLPYGPRNGGIGQTTTRKGANNRRYLVGLGNVPNSNRMIVRLRRRQATASPRAALDVQPSNLERATTI